jgi:CHAT domain-containing protein/tetratricopeptide (TPR) repeat protein
VIDSERIGNLALQRAFLVAYWIIVVSAALTASAQTVEELDARARQAFAAADYKQAAELSKLILELRQDQLAEGDFELVTISFNIGRALVRAQEFDESVPYLTSACRGVEAHFGPESGELGQCLLELVAALAGGSEPAQARVVATRALQIIERSFPPQGYAAALFHTGEIFREAEESEPATRYFLAAAKLYETDQLDSPEFLSASLSEAAMQLYELGRFGEAANALERAIPTEGLAPGTLDPVVISKIYLLAGCYREIGEFDRALALLNKVAKALTDVNVAGHVSASDMLLEVADLQIQNGGSSEALETLDRVLAAIAQPKSEADHHQYRLALTLAGEVHTGLQEYTEAEGRFRAAVADARAEPNPGALVEALQELGFFNLRRLRFAEARRSFDEALPIVERRQGTDSPAVAELLEQVVIGLIDQADCESARPFIERAISIYRKTTPKSVEMIRALKLAASCAETPNRKSERMVEALEMQRQLEGEGSVDWLVASAKWELDRGRTDPAEKALKRALELDPSHYGALSLQVETLEGRGRFAEASAALQQFLPAVAAVYGEDSINVAARRFNLGQLWIKAGNQPAARKSFLEAAQGMGRHLQDQFSLLSLGEQQNLLVQQTATQVSGILSACHSDPCLSEGYAVILPWKGLIIEGLRRQAEVELSMETQAKTPGVRRLKTVRTQLALWSSSRNSRNFEEWKVKHDRLTAEKEALERSLLAEIPTADSDMISLTKLQSSLRASEAMVDIYRFDHFVVSQDRRPSYAAIITSPGGGPQFVDLGSAEATDSLVAKWLTDVASGPATDAWEALRAGIWERIKKALPPGTRSVRISADGELLRIPWHGLSEQDADSVWEISEVDSSRSLMRARSRKESARVPDHFLVLGGLDYEAGRQPNTPGNQGQPFGVLEWSGRESKRLDELARQQNILSLWLKGDQATKAIVLEKLKGATYVHFATHGEVGEPADASLPNSWELAGTSDLARTPLLDAKLALSGANIRDPISKEGNGTITAEELLHADMRQTQLVVLSACNTGLGVKAPGQGVLGLRSALQAAGARRIIVSLWPVDDEATQLLMATFYTKLWVDDKPLLQAFHEAQESVRQVEGMEDPKFWAGWSVVDPE